MCLFLEHIYRGREGRRGQMKRVSTENGLARPPQRFARRTLRRRRIERMLRDTDPSWAAHRHAGISGDLLISQLLARSIVTCDLCTEVVWVAGSAADRRGTGAESDGLDGASPSTLARSGPRRRTRHTALAALKAFRAGAVAQGSRVDPGAFSGSRPRRPILEAPGRCGRARQTRSSGAPGVAWAAPGAFFVHERSHPFG